MHARIIVIISLVIVLFARAAFGADIYLARGAEGEASFSDVALPGAVAVNLDVHQPSQVDAEAVRVRMDATLAIAAELKDARLERENVYAERRAQAAQAAARRVPAYAEPEPRRVVGFPYGLYGYPRAHMRQRHPRQHGPRRPMPEPVQPPSVGRPILKRPGRRRGS